MMSIFTAWRRERQTIRELSRLSDHALADLGIRRAEIPGLAAAAHRPRGDAPADALAPAWGAHLRASVAA